MTCLVERVSTQAGSLLQAQPQKKGRLRAAFSLPIHSVCPFLLQDLFILLFTASRDPGIVPRNAVPPEIDEEAGVSASGTRRLPRTKDVVVNGITVKVKYCDTCMLYR